MSFTLQGKLTAFASRNARPIMIGGGGLVLGLMVLISMLWVFDLLFAPPVPDVRTASANEVAEFLAHRRGFSRLPMEERRRMLFELWGSGRQEELADEFAKLSSEEKDMIRSAAMDIGLDQLTREARRYNQLSPREREEFVEEALKTQAELKKQVAGLTDPFKDGLPTNQQGWTKMLVARTSASQRAKIKPLVDHMISASETRRTNRS